MWAKIAIATGVVAIAAFISTGRAQPTPGDPAPAPVRIGTYDSRAVALAWSRSDSPTAKAHRADLERSVKQGKAAEAAGKTEEYEAVKGRMIKVQFVQHGWVFSTLPPEDALAELKDQLPRIAREAGVALIVPRTDWQDASVQAVDLTDKIVAAFNPSPQTLKTLKGFGKQGPIKLRDLIDLKD
jgi:hypothetical protein